MKLAIGLAILLAACSGPAAQPQTAPAASTVQPTPPAQPVAAPVDKVLPAAPTPSCRGMRLDLDKLIAAKACPVMTGQPDGDGAKDASLVLVVPDQGFPNTDFKSMFVQIWNVGPTAAEIAVDPDGFIVLKKNAGLLGGGISVEKAVRVTIEPRGFVSFRARCPGRCVTSRAGSEPDVFEVSLLMMGSSLEKRHKNSRISGKVTIREGEPSYETKLPPADAAKPYRGPLEPKLVPAKVLEAHRLTGNPKIKPSGAAKAALTKRAVANFKFCIDELGRVQKVKMIKGSGVRRWDTELKVAIRRWTYRPFRVDGKPVHVCSMLLFIYEP